MLRVRLIVTAGIIVSAAALGGCGGISMPDWMSFHSSAPPPAALQFESDPPGADVRTAQGQTCLTPCSLTVPPESQAVSFNKPGYLPQTVQVTVLIPEHGMFDNPPPSIQPNPVAVVLQPMPASHRGGPPPKAKPHKVTHARTSAPPPPGSAAPPPPADSAFPPPPGQR